MKKKKEEERRRKKERKKERNKEEEEEEGRRKKNSPSNAIFPGITCLHVSSNMPPVSPLSGFTQNCSKSQPKK
jgi:hypothetical protein